MYEGHSIGVVVPAHNEAGFIGDVLEAIPDYVDETYVVDDASTDETWRIIQRYVEMEDARELRPALADGGSSVAGGVTPIRHQTNGGRGAAVKTGYRHALTDGMDVIAVVDGDGQMDPAILDRFLDPIVNGQADYAKGNRLLSADHRDGMSRWRLFGNTLLTFLTKVASGYWRMMDPQNGYTAIRASTLRSIDFDDLYDDYGFLNDVLVNLNVAGARIVDVGMRAKYGEEESGIRYASFVPKLSGLLLKDFVWRLGTKYLMFDFHPLVGLYLLGAAGTAGTAVFTAWALTSGMTGTHAVLGFGLLLFSGLLLTLAMIFDRAHNVRLENRIDDGIDGGPR